MLDCGRSKNRDFGKLGPVFVSESLFLVKNVQRALFHDNSATTCSSGMLPMLWEETEVPPTIYPAKRTTQSFT